MARTAILLAAGLLPALLSLPAAVVRAQAPPRNPIKVLEEELNLLKETIETNNNQIRKLRERLKKQEMAEEEREKAIEVLRKRLARIDVLQKELQAMEARFTEAQTAGGRKESAKLKMHAEVRVRPEYTQNRSDMTSDKDDQDAFWGHRVRLGGSFGFDDWVRAKVTVHDARKFGDTSESGAGLGLHEAWLDLKPTPLPGLRIRAGRMELSYGAERLLGADDFSLSGRAFDGALVRWGHLPYFDVEAFFTKVRESEGMGDHDRDFFGAYMMTQAIPFTTLELYYLGLIDTLVQTRMVGESLQELELDTAIHTIGARAEALFFESLRLDAELAIQLGSRTDDVDPTRELSHYAMAVYAEVSYQIPVTTYPTLAAFFAWSSGDANPTDDKSRDFQPLFPTRHTFLGTMDMLAWKNLTDIGGKLELTPPLGFGFFAGFHYFMLTQSKGELAGLGGGFTPSVDTPGRKELGKNVGMEIDIAVSWAPNDILAMEAGYSVFLPGTVLSEGLGFGDDAAHWAYLQTRVRY